MRLERRMKDAPKADERKQMSSDVYLSRVKHQIGNRIQRGLLSRDKPTRRTGDRSLPRQFGEPNQLRLEQRDRRFGAGGGVVGGEGADAHVAEGLPEVAKEHRARRVAAVADDADRDGL